MIPSDSRIALIRNRKEVRRYSSMLSRERLDRLRRVLDRQGGAETARQLTRRFAIFPTEIDAAEALGWVEIETRKPRTGRPSRIVRLSESQAAKLPPWRSHIPRQMKHRHWRFAFVSVNQGVPGGLRRYNVPPLVEVYRVLFPAAKSEAGAAASCSRLLRHPHVFAARQYCYARACGEIPRDGNHPSTASEVWEILRRHKSWRAELAPLALRLLWNLP